VSYQVTPPEAPQPNDSREGTTTTTLPLEQVPNGAG
jgi:hypothetical protein